MRVSEVVWGFGVFSLVLAALLLISAVQAPPRHALPVQLAAAPSGQICSPVSGDGCAVQFIAADVSQPWGLPDDKLLV